jgi:HPt (histidine-containing phosphotransfer) domain-containing protein
MDIQITQGLTEAGIDVKQGIGRVGGNEALYQKLLRKFLQEGTYSALLESIEQENWPAAAEKIHTLKGLAANLSMEALREDSIRAEQNLKAGLAPENMASLTANYQKVIGAIQTLIGQG